MEENYGEYLLKYCEAENSFLAFFAKVQVAKASTLKNLKTIVDELEHPKLKKNMLPFITSKFRKGKISKAPISPGEEYHLVCWEDGETTSGYLRYFNGYKDLPEVKALIIEINKQREEISKSRKTVEEKENKLTQYLIQRELAKGEK